MRREGGQGRRWPKNLSAGRRLEEAAKGTNHQCPGDEVRKRDRLTGFFAPAPQIVISSYAAPFMAEPKTILIVDDDPTVHHLLAAVLAPHGWRIESAFDGLEGWQRVEAFPYDLVLTDVRMPGMDGLELLGRIRQLRPDTKVMVMTADSTPDHIIRSTREKAFSYFSKPFSPSAVAEMIAKAFSAPAWPDDIEVLSARPEWFALKVRCRRETADRLVQFLREMKMDLPEQQREDMAAAFHELLMNAIEHGGHSNPNKRVRVAYVRTSRAIDRKSTRLNSSH